MFRTDSAYGTDIEDIGEREHDSSAHQLHWFNCLGDLSVKDHRLGGGYINKGEPAHIFNPQRNGLSLGVVQLFGKSVNEEAALLSDTHQFFQVARKNFLIILYSATKTDTRLFGVRPPNTKTREANYSHLRKEICQLMSYIRRYISINVPYENIWIFRKIAPSISKNLFSLRLLVKNISDLPSHILNLPSNSLGNQCPHAAYHLLHLQLDLWWYQLTVLHHLERLSRVGSLEECLSSAGQQLQQLVQLLLTDLVNIALLRFEKLSLNDLKKKSPFSCSCVKELWLLVQIYLDKKHKQDEGNDFWQHVNQLLAAVLVRTPTKKPAQTDCSSLVPNESFSCSNPIGFSLWMLVYLTQLYGYTECGRYEGSSCNRMEANYPQLEKILKTATSPESSVSEAQLRAYIPLVCELVTGLWPPRSEPVVLLWQHFHQRLNSCFFLQGATPDTMAVVSKSGVSLMRQVAGYLDAHSLPTANSFEQFLRLLGTYLRRSPAHWQQVKGRIYSKFFPAKMQALKEIGIYHVCALFLTLAMTVDMKEVGSKMQELLQVLMNGSLDIARRHMVWKSHLALIQLHIVKGTDIKEVASPLLKDVMNVNAHKNHETVVLLGTFIEGLQDVINNSEALELSEHTLIGGWTSYYLSNSPDPRPLLDVLLGIAAKVLDISQRVGMIEYDACNSQLTLMYQALCEHVLPYLKIRFESSEPKEYHNQLPDLAENLTLLALNRANVGVNTQSFTTFFQTFAVNASPMNVKLIIRYMSRLLRKETIISELSEAYSNYDVIIIQTWFRCVVYAADEESQELQELTQIVCQLPSIVALSESTSIRLESEADPMLPFVCMLGRAYLALGTDRGSMKLREQFAHYLYTSVQNFKPVLHNRAVSERIVGRICQLAACLMVHCGPIIYTKSNPSCIFNLVTSHLLLPMELFKPETQLHPYLVNALRRTFHLFVRGIARINAANGNILSTVFKNLVVQYFARLLGKPGPNATNHSHPLMLCFNESEDKDVARLILEIITTSFVKTRNLTAVNQSSSLALMFVLDLLRQKNYSEEMVQLVISCSLRNILEVFIFGSVTCPVLKRQALNILNETLINKIRSSPELSQNFQSVVLAVSSQHFPQNGSHVLAMLSKLCELAPSIMTAALPKLESIIDSLGHSRSFEFKATMSRGLENLKKMLEIRNDVAAGR